MACCGVLLARGLLGMVVRSWLRSLDYFSSLMGVEELVVDLEVEARLDS
jgi:hypothetical protein